jgi:hypothetical protein
MRTLLTSLALCALASAAGAQCTAAPQAKAPTDRGDLEWIRTANAAPNAPAVRQASGGPMIRVAAREEHPRPTPVASVSKAGAAPAEPPPRRSGSAMLLAVLAVMTGIALRRAGASGR